MRRAHDHSIHGADRSIPTIGEPMKIRREHSLYGLLAVGLASMPAAAPSHNPQHATHHASHHDPTHGLVRRFRNANRHYLPVSKAEADGRWRERRGRNECVSTSISRGRPDTDKKQED